MQMIIFDVDDTLVQSAELEHACYRQAVRETLGDVTIRPQWADYLDVTDAGILRDICRDNGLDPSQDYGTEERFADLIAASLSDTPDVCLEVPGARSTVEHLLQRDDVSVGIATGGWLRSARLKLRHIGLDTDRLAMASSNHGTTRCQIMTACQRMLGHATSPPIYVGDGPWDARSCALLGWSFIAVGPRLKGHSRNWCANFCGSNFTAILEHVREEH